MVTKVQIKRINKLIDFLLTGVHKDKFDLGHWVGEISNSKTSLFPDPFKMKKHPTEKPECNTSACVVGWFPHLFPKLAEWKQSKHDSIWKIVTPGKKWQDHEGMFYNITGIEAVNKIIYYDHDWGEVNYKSDNPTPQAVAKRIIQVAKKEGIDLGR